MQTIRAAADTLARASSVASLAAIAAALGFDADPLPLDSATCEELGLPADIRHACIVRGPGDLRAILGEVDGGPNLRELVSRTATRLSARAPHMLCLLLLVERHGPHVAIASWSRSAASVRVAALFADRGRILDSDADTLCALGAAVSSNDVLTHVRWLEVLGRESLTRRFYLTLRTIVHALGENASGPGDAAEKHEIALLYVSRLLFLSFIEAKGWLDGDRGFLVRSFETSCESGGGYEHRVLRPLLFGTLNTRMSARAPVARRFGRIPFLNGGLFTPTPLERRLRALRFGDEHLGRVFAELLGRYRFTAREDSSSWSEAAIDPEMLGKSFESLMAGERRRDSGAFYTPQSLVESVTRSALLAALTADGLSDADVARVLDGDMTSADILPRLRSRLDALTVLDPACGSGAFLVHMLGEIARVRAAAGDERTPAEIRREVLASSIFGVDVNRTAVWLCELRLWLSVVIEAADVDPLRVPPLPNLDHHIRVGDTLLGGDFTGLAGMGSPAALAQLRVRYARSSGNRKRTLSRALDRVERDFARRALDASIAAVRARRRELLLAHRGADLFGDRRRPDRPQAVALTDLRTRARALRAARRKVDDGEALPFSFAAHFPDIAAAGGFGVVIGNPPWVRLHRIPAASRVQLRAQYTVFRNAGWRDGAAGARAGAGFASQVDLAALFAERSIALLRDRGAFALLLPSKLWRSLAGGGLRELVRRQCELLAVEDWTESPALFDAAVYPSLLVARRGRCPAAATPCVRVTRHAHARTEQWCTAEDDLAVRAEAAAPWLFLPPTVRDAFRLLENAGTPFCDTALGRPMLGVKCGCNEAFVVSIRMPGHLTSTVCNAGRTGEVESAMLRPALRGADVRPWSSDAPRERIVWTHDALGRPMARLPKHAARWLSGWRTELAERSDARRLQRWWSLFRTEAALTDRPRVVWSDFGKRPRATMLAVGDDTVPLNTCYVCRCATDDDALALCALLNSPLTAAWLNAIAEPARGGFHRYLAWTIAMLPVPSNWNTSRSVLAVVARDALAGRPPDENALLQVTLDAYGIARSNVSPLVEWMPR